MTLTVTVLGSGSSSGTPMAGLGWGKCDPNEPRNRRLRASILLRTNNTTALVDTSPDLRQQLLNADVSHLDAVLYTHAHADHLHGIDDLRSINRAMDAPIKGYADAATLKQIDQRFGYVIQPLSECATHYYKPTLDMTVIEAGETFAVGDIPVATFDQDHGFSRTLGYRFGAFAYTTDVCEMPEVGFDVLARVDTWYIGVFTDTPHATHVHVDKALGWIERVRPRRAILGHLGPDLCYRDLSASLPDGVEAAFDGMCFDVAMAAVTAV